jgi:hypothetical protein
MDYKFSNNLKAIREILGIAQTELAKSEIEGEISVNRNRTKLKSKRRHDSLQKC